ncbi:hypothetical protein EJ03DRAFT_193743 [Teratosphaeria nubilosa]|uniref:PD-(D/E)XK nuclease-like domain-containing protein n=1 Tax=Teratosphaeria nubilosa TaxID=161662 RepID=A0A6G1L022_9PEZI|nr:hypothetical protein EJ03DRAFT_193743 [Teratosphaeria nubilosa]
MSARKRCIEWLASIEAGAAPTPDAPSPQDSVLDHATSCKRARTMDDAIDEETTPRPSRAKRTRAATTADDAADIPYDSVLYRDSDDRDDHDDDDDQSASLSSHSKRSRTSNSPTKGSGSSLTRQTNRLMAEGQYDERLISDLGSKDALPPPLAQLLTKVATLADGTDTLPQSLRPQLEQEDINASRQDLFYDDHNHMLSLWDQIEDLIKQARRCRLRRDYEAGWNSAVHHPLLNLACRLAGGGDHVWAVNISDVRPQKRLLPFGQEIRKKMVDFGLVINTQASNQRLASFYRSPRFPLKPHRDVIKTWNHTEGQLLAQHPLAVSIETKRQADKDDEAQLQLGTWGTAHLKRLMELRKTKFSQEPADVFLPQIKVQGALFFFMLLRGVHDGTTSLKVTLYTGKMMGDVTEYGGFFRVLACLRAIVEWTDLAYGPWLEDWTGVGGD